MDFDQSKLDSYPNLKKVVGVLLDIWPEHAEYCESRFKGNSPEFMQRSDELAGLAIKLTEKELKQYCEDYRWMCEEFLEEEIYFRRHDAYRRSTFKEAYDEVYNDDSYMSRYVHGILISLLIWAPHAEAFDYFRTDFLPGNPEGSKYLEVGPGHGLFLYFAAQDKNLKYLEAWDVSKSSIAATRHALSQLGVERDIDIIEQDVLKASAKEQAFDCAIISEVLEHLEEPDKALQTLFASLRPGGRLFINVPINSPAPDHIYLWRTTDEFVDFVKAQGFEIESSQFLPVTGNSLERAVKRKLSISCILIAKRPE